MKSTNVNVINQTDIEDFSNLTLQEQVISFLYVCMVNTIYLLSFVETPRKFNNKYAIINIQYKNNR